MGSTSTRTSQLPQMVLEVGAATDPGRVRPRNEDYLLYEIPGDPTLAAGRGNVFLVADGVGGVGGGAIASAEAAHTVMQEYYLGMSSDPSRTLRRAMEQANLHVYNLRTGHPNLAGMQTTLTVLVLCEGRYWLGHIGDSKALLLRDGVLRQLTRDHTMVQEMRRLGLVDSARVGRHPHRHLLTRTVGGDMLVDVDLQGGPVRVEDCFILATDGLFEHLEFEDVRRAFENSPVDHAAKACVEEGNRRGGFDNLTVLAVRITS